jgi:IPT/TIG domain
VEVSNTGAPHWAQAAAAAVTDPTVTPDASWTDSGIRFLYDAPVQITSVVPHLGPSSGNFTVTITGGPFPDPAVQRLSNGLPTDVDLLRCRFGALAVRAVYVSATMLLCYAPPQQQGQYSLEVSLNDQDFTAQNFPFLYYTDPGMSRITPISGPAVAADTQVQLLTKSYSYRFVYIVQTLVVAVNKCNLYY